jgi:acetyl-CoA hydrolase
MSWAEDLKARTVSAEEAVRVIRSGHRVLVQPGCGAPLNLLRAMAARARELQGVELAHLMIVAKLPYLEPEFARSFRHVGFFLGAGTREAVARGEADYIPVYLSEIPALFTRGEMRLDVALINVSPPDEHGFCSFGVDVSITKTAAQNARCVIAEINEQMPRTLGDSFIHVSKIHHIVRTNSALPELPRVKMTDVHSEIGRRVADLIEDGSTLQMGIGGIPDAVLFHLKGRRDLGVHTEMFSDGVQELIESGVITNEKKTLHPGKVVASFLLGSRRLFDYVDNNPLIEMHPTEYVNDPFIVSQHDRMVAINSALQVDLTGQVCAHSLGDMFYSGFGGQVDFIRGAARSKGGKPIIALPATADGGTISRIAPQLTPGAAVTTNAADVHYVVTEFGVASLHGKNVRQRARALIDIAHPAFRDELTAWALKAKRL